MTKKLNLLLIVATISVISVGCTKNTEKTTPTNNQETNTQKTEVVDESVSETNIATTTLPSILNLKPGDKVGSFTVTTIGALNKEKPFSANNFSISLSGQATITGKYEMNYLLGSYFITPDDTTNLPSFLERKFYEVSFPDNTDKFNDKGKITEGRATVTFDGLIIEDSGLEYSMTGSKKIITIEILK